VWLGAKRGIKQTNLLARERQKRQRTPVFNASNCIITVGTPAGFSPPSLMPVKPKSKYKFLADFPSGTDLSKVWTKMFKKWLVLRLCENLSHQP
jgi:hypothetical protein